MINKLTRKAYQNAVDKGFHDEPTEIGTRLALIHSEVSEALEADRKGKYCSKSENPLIVRSVLNIDKNHEFEQSFEDEIKDTFEDELADTIIRVFDLAGQLKIDLESHVMAKMRYNSMREPKHGKKY